MICPVILEIGAKQQSLQTILYGGSWPPKSMFLQTDLDRIDNWFCYNELSLIVLKSEVMNCGNSIPKDLTLNNEKLPNRNSCTLEYT